MIVDIEIWYWRFMLFALLLVGPFIEFVAQQDYHYLNVEVVIITSFLLTGSALLAVVTRNGYVFGATFLVGMCALSAPHVSLMLLPFAQIRPFHILLAGPIGIGSLVYLMGKKRFYAITALFLAALFVSGTAKELLTPQTRVEVGPQPATADATRPSDPPIVLYMILDSYMGPAGFPDTIEESRNAVRSIYDTFLDNDFTLYPNAYSNYYWTMNSLSSALNFRLLDRSRFDRGLPVDENAVMDHFHKLGYSIFTYESTEVAFPGGAQPADRRVIYEYHSLGSIERVSMPWKDRLLLLSTKYAASVHRALVKRLYRPAIRYGDHMIGMLSHLEAWGQLEEDILNSKGKTLFFAHFLTPHFPYLYRRSGELRPVAEWRGHGNMYAHTVTESAGPKYEALYQEYAEQVQYLNSQLDALLRSLEEHGLKGSARIIIHSDHGSRIVCCPTDESTPDELLDAYSTLLAVREPGSREGHIDEQRKSLMWFLNEIIHDGNQKLPEGLDRVYHWKRGGGGVGMGFLDRFPEVP